MLQDQGSGRQGEKHSTLHVGGLVTGRNENSWSSGYRDIDEDEARALHVLYDSHGDIILSTRIEGGLSVVCRSVRQILTVD